MDLEAIGILILSVGLTAVSVLLGVLVNELRVQERGEERRHRDRIRQGDQLVEAMSGRAKIAQPPESLSFPDLDLPAPPAVEPASARTPLSTPTVIASLDAERDNADDPTVIFVGPPSVGTKVSSK